MTEYSATQHHDSSSTTAHRRLAVGCLLACLMMAVFCGCSRMKYRQRADEQSYAIMAEKTADPRWTLPRMDITPDPRSRFHDPYCLDRPPLPPDDPAAHQYMHCADGKRGWERWQDFGQSTQVENPDWPVYLGGQSLDGSGDESLPAIEDVTLTEAIELGLIHSREYQEQLEDVYLSALSLTYNRYRYQLRFSGLLGEPGTAAFLEHQPNDETGVSLGTSNLGVSKLLPAGGQLVAELTNQTLWLFSGPGSTQTTSTFGFFLVQPLLRHAGREVALERLTQAERSVLYAVRSFARFRKDFYVMLVTGERAIPLPGSTGGSELAFLIRGERAPTVGFYFLLFQDQRLRNRTENVRSLEMRLKDVQAMMREGTAAALDVTQVQTSLEQARTSRTIRQRFFGDQLDRFKLQLGLPPGVELTIDDSLLAPFELENEGLTDLESQLRDMDSVFEDLTSPSNEALLKTARQLAEDRRTLTAEFEATQGKLEQLVQSIEERIVGLSDESSEEFRNIVTDDAQRFEKLRADFVRQSPDLDTILRQLEQGDAHGAELQQILRDLRRRRNVLSRFTRQLKSVEGAIRVELIGLEPVCLTPRDAVRLALENRLDLMNRRALLMDARRRLEVAADELEATVDLVAEAEVNTPPLVGNGRPLDFRADESNFRIGVEIETPLDRRRERNNFRAAQVGYQRARRNFMAAEDQVKLDVRSELRQIQAQRELFEIQRRALRVATRELEQALESGEREDGDSGGGRQQGLNIPRALENILDAQDELIEAWVEYETARLQLYRDMGVMQIDEDGTWSEAEQQCWAFVEPDADVEELTEPTTPAPVE